MARGKTVRLQTEGNTIAISQCDYTTLTLWLNDNIVNLDKKVKVTYKGKTIFNAQVSRTADNLRNSLYDRGDLSYSFPAKVELKIKK